MLRFQPGLFDPFLNSFSVDRNRTLVPSRARFSNGEPGLSPGRGEEIIFDLPNHRRHAVARILWEGWTQELGGWPIR